MTRTSWICRKFLVFLLTLGSFSYPAYSYSSNYSSDATAKFLPAQLQTFTTHSRLIFKIDNGVDVVWKNTSGGFEILFKSITAADLGAQYGLERNWKDRFSSLSDKRLKSLNVIEDKDGVRVVGAWKFLSGDQAPAVRVMENFQFRLSDSAQYIVDFWQKKGPTVAQIRMRKLKKDQENALKNAEVNAKKRMERRRELASRREDLADVSKFCREPVTDDSDVFLPFNAVHPALSLQKWIPINLADGDYPYREPKGDDRESQYVRLALKLYDEGKLGLAMRTVDFLVDEYPHSMSHLEMKFLRANALLKMGMEQKAVQIFRELILASRGTSVALHSAIFLAGQAFEHKEYLSALEQFYWLIQNHPEHRLNGVFHLGAAECLAAIKQTNRAAAEYRWITESVKDSELQAEAAYRMGNVFLADREYDQAVAAYYNALKVFPRFTNKFPFASINRAEALYWLKQYDRSESAFLDFLKNHPSDPQGWKATFRLGEILSRRSGKKNLTEARDWFAKTINQFPLTPGVVLARLRIAACDDHGGFSPSDYDRFIEKEAKKYTGDGQVHMAQYHEVLTLSRIRALVTFGRYSEAVELASQFLKDRPHEKMTVQVSGIFKKALRKNILTLIEEGKKLEAISFYNTYVDLIPKDDNPIVPDFVLKLSQAASDMKLGNLAKNLVDSYYQVSEAEVNKRAIATEGLSKDSLDESLRISEEKFTEAKSLWIRSREKAEPEILSLLAMVADESPFSFQREVILGLLSQAKGSEKSALVHAAKAKVLGLGKDEYDEARLKYWVATLHQKTGDFQTAVALISEVLLSETGRAVASKKKEEAKKDEDKKDMLPSETLGLLGVPDVPSDQAMVIQQGKIFEQQELWADAARVYQGAVEKGIDSGQMKYALARALKSTQEPKNVEKANLVLEEMFKNEKDEFWRNMAAQNLGKEIKKQ